MTNGAGEPGKVFAGSFDGKVYAFGAIQSIKSPQVNQIPEERNRGSSGYEGYIGPIIPSGIFLVTLGLFLSRLRKNKS